MDYLSECIADFYLKRCIIMEDEKEVYKYGVQLILNDMITFSLIIVVSALIWKVQYAIEFLITLCLTRIYCGGFHARKAHICKISTLTLFFVVIIMSFFLKSIDFDTLISLLICNFIFTLPFIPVTHPNKTMTLEQRKWNRNIGVISYLFFSMCACFVWNYIDNQEGVIIALSLSAVTALVLIGTYFNCKEVSVCEKKRIKY